MLETIGRYRITSKLGEGGMGVVYAAHDERLDRLVAIKMIRDTGADTPSRDRLWREARSAASINHPNVCQLYEIGEDHGELFIAMELLEGESLAARIARGALSLPETIQLSLSFTSVLDALHRRGLVHRDLKPSNVFLTTHGIKLLDFGLARSTQDSGDRTETSLTAPGLALGTPSYMAPEQLLAQPVDQRADIFSLGVMIFEMLSGKPPFGERSTLEVLHAVLYDHPPVLGGSPAITAVDRVIQRAMAKSPEDRYQTAEALAQDLRAALLLVDADETPRARPMTRLIVLPFRILRADSETDFLAFGLADAIASTLSGLESLVVRSSMSASRFTSDALDLKAIATEADVDIVLTGTLLRAADQVRVSTQLLEAPAGTILWSQTSQVSLGDLFQLQDDLAHRIVESLSLPLTAREHRQLKHDVPANAKAYEFYLRANELSLSMSTWGLARDLYERCLEQDPRYAPAWARLGRIYRVLAKYEAAETDENWKRADAAFKRALELNPDLSVAHNLSAYLDTDLGRAPEAMIRLLERAKARRADPELLAGLVHTCRYCGLLNASLAAFEQARRLDKTIQTSITHTLWMRGEYQRAWEETPGETTGYIQALALTTLGRNQEAIAKLRDAEGSERNLAIVGFWTSLRALLEGSRAEGVGAIERTLRSDFRDPEGLYYLARTLSQLGEPNRAMELLEASVEGGFFCFSAMSRDPWLDSLRANPDFTRVLRRAEARHREALTAFLQIEGDRVLNLSVGP